MARAPGPLGGENMVRGPRSRGPRSCTEFGAGLFITEWAVQAVKQVERGVGEMTAGRMESLIDRRSRQCDLRCSGAIVGSGIGGAGG